MSRFKGFVLVILCIIQVQLGKGQHFTPVYSGNPYNPMNILITSISVDNKNLEAGDEIGVFDSGICVGAIVYKGEDIIGISASMADPGVKQKDGFKFGNPISFKIWKRNIDFEYMHIDAYFSTLFDTVFIPLGTAIVDLKSSIKEQRPRIYPNQIFSVNENALQNTFIGQFKVDFPKEKLGFRILQNEQNLPFSIDSSGKILIKNPGLIDYSHIKEYIIPIQVFCDRDQQLSDTSTCKIDILRIPPSIISIKKDTAFVGSDYKQVVRIANATSKNLSVIPSFIPLWLTIRLENNEEIIFEGIPGPQDVGTSEVSFLLSDETNLIQQKFLIETIRKDNAPIISLNNNPTHGPFKLIFDQFGENDTPVEVIIKKLNGGIVYKNSLKSTDNRFILDVDLSGNSKAIYLVEVKYKNHLITKKLLLQ